MGQKSLIMALPIMLGACGGLFDGNTEGWIYFRGAGGSYQLSHIICKLQISYSGYGFDFKGISLPISYAGFSTTITVGSANISRTLLEQTTSLVRVADFGQQSACIRSIQPPPSEAWADYFQLASNALQDYIAVLPSLKTDPEVANANDKLKTVGNASPGQAAPPKPSTPSTPSTPPTQATNAAISLSINAAANLGAPANSKSQIPSSVVPPPAPEVKSATKPAKGS
jgi:hypothetical protein